MEEQNCENALQFSPMPINWIANNASGLVDGFGANQHYIMTQGRNEMNQVPLVIPEWIQCQQTPQNYVEYLAESGCREIKEGMSYNMFSQVSNLELADPSQVEDYQRLHYEENLIPVTGMEHQSIVQKQDCNPDYSNDSQGYIRSGAAALKCSSKVHRRRSREKSYAADRCRRLRISQWLDALQELLPHQKKGCKETLLDNVIDHVKHLQYQVKDLCRSRLGGDLTSNSIIFLEGHGHYLVNEQKLNGPLEEMMGELLEVNPLAATELLQSRGLIVMPSTFVEELCESAEIQDMQYQETKQRSVAPSGL